LANQLDQQAAAISKKVTQGAWNKSGFILDVAWIDPITGNTVKHDRMPLGQGSTIVHGSNEEPYKVKLSVWGKTLAESGIAAVGTALTAGGLALAGEALGIGAAAWGAKLGGKVMGIGAVANREDGSLRTFWTGTPSGNGRYEDVWGTVWNPQHGTGGLL
jgi:hypothetical protein